LWRSDKQYNINTNSRAFGWIPNVTPRTVIHHHHKPAVPLRIPTVRRSQGEELLWKDYEVKLSDQALRTMETYMGQFPDVRV